MSEFNIRVYGICIVRGKLLVCDERVQGIEMTKFPGGGLEQGEGTRDCLIRELKEETQAEIEVLEHVYTTDYYQPSVFDAKQQVIAIYYAFSFLTTPPPVFSTRPFDFTKGEAGNAISFRWLDLKELSPEQFTFPIDKRVAELIRLHPESSIGR